LVTAAFSADGELERTFGEQGVHRWTVQESQSSYGSALALDDQGRILIAGEADSGAFADAYVMRFLAN
jgi:hypothetical protein